MESQATAAAEASAKPTAVKPARRGAALRWLAVLVGAAAFFFGIIFIQEHSHPSDEQDKLNVLRTVTYIGIAAAEAPPTTPLMGYASNKGADAGASQGYVFREGGAIPFGLELPRAIRETGRRDSELVIMEVAGTVEAYTITVTREHGDPLVYTSSLLAFNRE